MPLPNIVLLPSTQGQINVTGSAKRASGSSRSVGSLYTVVMTSHALRGRVYVEGTLAASPTEEDWFAIPMPGLETPYVQFPNDLSEGFEGVQNVGFNFKGNLVWIRARLDRDYLDLDGLTEQQLAPYGYLDQVVMNAGAWVSENGLPTTDAVGGVGVSTVRGNNLGSGSGIYSASLGQSNVLLNFKTLIAGENVEFDVDSTSITINTTGGGGSGGGGTGSFLNLTEAPASIVNNGILIGRAGMLRFIPAPANANQFLRWSGSEFVWTNVSEEVERPNLDVREDGTTVSNEGMAINFGNGLDVDVVNGIPTVSIPQAQVLGEREYVYFQYTAGASGNLSAGDAIITSTAGVTATIIDTANCLVEFRFTGRQYPPSSVAVMGQAQQSNDFNYSNVNPSMSTRKIAGGGTAAAPTFLGNFAGPITLQLRMSDIGASAPVGQRAKGVVLFRF